MISAKVYPIRRLDRSPVLVVISNDNQRFLPTASNPEIVIVSREQDWKGWWRRWAVQCWKLNQFSPVLTTCNNYANLEFYFGKIRSVGRTQLDIEMTFP